MIGKVSIRAVGLVLAAFLLAGPVWAGGQGEPMDPDAPLEFTMFSSDVNSQYDDFESPVAQEIARRTGVTLSMEYPVGNSDERVQLMAASGDYPDLLFAKGSSNVVVNAGGFVDMTGYIEEKGENIREMYGQFLTRLRWSPEDPSIYILNSNPIGEQTWEPPNGFQLQHAVVKELGYPEIRTVKDFENAVREYAERYPEINGQRTIPWMLNMDDWRILIDVTNPAVFATGQYGDDGEWFIDQETLEPIIHHRRPVTREYFRWVNHMYHEGLLDPESFTQPHDQYEAKIASGRVLGLSTAQWQINQPETALRQAGTPERTYGFYPVTLNEDIPYRAAFYPAGDSFGWGVGITVDNPYPERAFEFLDWMASEESNVLRQWGIEGEHYDVVDGRRVQKDWVREGRESDEFFGRETGIDVYAYPFPRYGRGVLDSSGNPFVPITTESIIENYTEVEKEVLAAYGATMWRDLFPTDFGDNVKPYGYAWQLSIASGTDPHVIWQRVQEINWRRIPESILAPRDEFDAVWDSYQQELTDAGVEELEEYFAGLLRARVEFWSE
ncbi:MAG: ABC transporter substrate-binding protein [Spirochaetota bacterium]